MPKILDFIDFCKDLPEIKTTKILNNKKFHKDGLFSEQIFGPLKNYTCQCGEYTGVILDSSDKSTCDICGVDIVHSNERRKRYAQILLPLRVINPIFYDLISIMFKTNIMNMINTLMKNEKSILYIQDDEYVLTTDRNTIPENMKTYDKIEAIEKIVETYIDSNIDEDNPSEFDIAKANINKLTIDRIIVLPPDLRPASTNVSNNNRVVDQINRYYVQILTKKEYMSNTALDITIDKQLYYNYFRQIQKNVNELYKHILEKLSKKEGLIRGNILGKRIDFSGRAVITPEPTLSLDECELPYFMILEIFKIQIARKLLDIGKFKLVNKAINFVDECIDNKSYILLKLCQDVCHNKLCLINRQPSLHRMSMLGLKFKITTDNVIKTHPLHCHSLNADYDGDCVNADLDVIFENKHIKTPIKHLEHHNAFQFYKRKEKEDGQIIKKYKAIEDMFIKAIDPDSGKTDMKKITEFSIHENIKMYNIEDPKKRFESFHCSEDHSMIVYDEIDGKIKKISPKELKQEPKGKYLIQEKLTKKPKIKNMFFK